MQPPYEPEDNSMGDVGEVFNEWKAYKKEGKACAKLCEDGIIKGGEVFAAKIRARGNT